MKPTVILVPVLNRPANIKPLIKSAAEGTPEPHRLLFIANESDRLERKGLELADAEHIVVPDSQRSYACKINAGTAASDEPLIFSGADDLDFHPGWLRAAQAKLTGTVEVVGTNDLGNPRTISGEHSTHSLFTRSYIDDAGGVIDAPPGVVLNEQYPHEFCDDEFVQTAMARGVYAHAFDSHVEHLHYLWGKGNDDATYRVGRSRTGRGRRIFNQRRRLWQT